MKYCTHCGNQVLDEAVLCPKCGCAFDTKKNIENTEQQKPVDMKTSLGVVYILNAIFLPLVGLIFGIILLCQSNKTQKFKTIAILTIVLSVIFAIIWCGVFIALMLY